jgi:predicted nucleotidyltransferase
MARTARRRPVRRSLADALFTRTQQRVLRVLFGQSDRSFYASELIRQAGAGSGATQRELARLEGSGLVTTKSVGHQKHFQANPESPLFAELRAIVLKTVGLAEPLRAALSPLSAGIRAAFVYGSVAKERDRSGSDIDLMVISEGLTYGEVFGALEPVTRVLGRPVNPTVFTPAELSRRVRDESAFVRRVLEQPRIWVIGGDRDQVPETLGLGPEIWRVLAKSHDLRNKTEYEGAIDVDERLVSDLITACRKVADAVAALGQKRP